VKEYLENLFNVFLDEVEASYDKSLAVLKKPTETLGEFTFFVENLNKAVENAGPLKAQKEKVERMKEILKK